MRAPATLASRRKQRFTDEEFESLWSSCRNLVSASRLNELAARTLEEIERTCKGRSAAIGWSGGKDSLVLEHLCRRLGITGGALVITDLEVPEFVSWLANEKPSGMTVVKQPLDLPWLQRNSSLLFPRDHIGARRWSLLVQHAGLRRFCQTEAVDLLLLGRRRVDGNYVPTENGVYESEGIRRYTPLRDWDHAEILAYLRHWGIEIPPVYHWPRGFRLGTGPWASRQWCGTVEDTWKEIFEIDPGIVYGAADYLDSAAAFLNQKK